MSLWTTYVQKNPVRAETRRSFRRFFGLGKLTPRATRNGAAALAVIYLLILDLAWYGGGVMPAQGYLFVELVVLLLAATLGFYASISGERERRTWDLLRVAPVTNGQIVVGKFMGGALVLFLGWAAAFPFL